MQRTTAKLLLLFALAGNLIPLGLAATATPPHACCIRRTHQCHSSNGSNSSQPEFRNTDCCRQNSAHAVITAQWAHPQAQAPTIAAQAVSFHVKPNDRAALLSESLCQHSTRAPPGLARI